MTDSSGVCSGAGLVFLVANASLLSIEAFTHPHFGGVVLLLSPLEVVDADVDASSELTLAMDFKFGVPRKECDFCGRLGVPLELL